MLVCRFVEFPDGEEIGKLKLPVIVIRKERLIDKVFTISVATLVSVLFVNFGCALDWNVLVETFRKPASLLVGIVPQFIFMPLVSKLINKVFHFIVLSLSFSEHFLEFSIQEIKDFILFLKQIK